jgi:glycosyltransferase involved in cell wall biosynthesis
MDEAIKKTLNKLNIALVEENFEQAVSFAYQIISLPVEEAGAGEILRAAVILGFALVKLSRFEEAKRVLIPFLEKNTGVVDTSYLLFCIASAEKNYDDIIYYGNRFAEAISDPKNPPVCFTSAVDNAYELLNNLAITLLNDEQYEKAIEYLKKGLEYKRDFPLLYINLAIAYYRLKKFEEALGILKEGRTVCTDNTEITRTLGLIHAENKQYLKAEMAFAEAHEKGSTEALFDLAILYQSLFKIYAAEQTLLEYLKLYPEHNDSLQLLQEIRSYPFYGKPEPKLSAAMIVKNEEEMLAECIESFREAVDEIVIVDTGSTDRTVEIAQQYQVQLYHHKWKDDFSEARNFSISKVTGDWVLIIDADERMERADIPKVRMSKWQDKYNAVCFAVFSSLPGHAGGADFGKHYSPRLFKKRDDIYYYGIVHNLLNVPTNIAVSEIRLYHLGYDLDRGKMLKKFNRSITLLQKQVKDQPDDPFVLMNIAQMYLSRNFANEGEPYALKCVSLLENNPEDREHLLLMAYYQLSLVGLHRREYQKCIEYCQKALHRKPNYIDVLLTLGYCYYNMQEYDKAIETLDKYLTCRQELLNKEEFNLLILSKLGSDYEAEYVLGEIYRQKKDYQTAKKHYGNALNSNTFYWCIHNSLGKIFLEEHNYSAATASFENAIKYGYLNLEKYGTTGQPLEEYKQTIENYKLSIEKDVAAQKSRPTVTDALGRIDALLDN